MEDFVLFKDKYKLRKGFYFFKFKLFNKEWLERVYIQDRKHHYSNVYSYFCTMKNEREDMCGMDCMIYRWTNSYRSNDALHSWRRMTRREKQEFKKELYMFNRPSRFYPNGKKP